MELRRLLTALRSKETATPIFGLNSSGDSLRTLHQRVRYYLTLGVPTSGSSTPGTASPYYASAQGYSQPTDGFLRLPGTGVAVSLEEMFQELDIA